MALNMDRSAWRQFLLSMFAAVGDTLKLTTRSVSGHKHFTAWEWEMSFNVLAESDVMKGLEARGQRVEMIGVSLAWWNEEGKIFRERDYARAKGGEEGTVA